MPGTHLAGNIQKRVALDLGRTTCARGPARWGTWRRHGKTRRGLAVWVQQGRRERRSVLVRSSVSFARAGKTCAVVCAWSAKGGIHALPCVRERASASVAWSLLTVKIRQPSHEFTFGVGMSFIPYPLVLTPVV
jgi:hypothetical protein